MAYFNHAFRQVHVGTTGIIPAGQTTADLFAAGVGTYGLFDKDTNISVDAGTVANQSLILASTSLILEDKRGQFHGGYAESNKSKYINPKLVNRFYKVNSNQPAQQVSHLGNTNFQTGCEKEMFCEETYTLNLELIGAPALRFANRELYRRFDAYTGCCVDGAPSNLIDSTLVMIDWAKQILDDPFFKGFLDIVVYDELGNSILPANFDTYVSPGHTPGALAGIRFVGAYVDTKFGICSYDPKDYINKEPVRIEAQLVDVEGNACNSGICFEVECEGLQQAGLGDTILNEVVLSQSYLQNFLSSDVRLREITGGDDILAAIDRTVFYDRYFILHSVPRYSNASGIYDNDQYLLELIVASGDTAIEAVVAAWMTAANSNIVLEDNTSVYSCTPVAI